MPEGEEQIEHAVASGPLAERRLPAPGGLDADHPGGGEKVVRASAKAGDTDPDVDRLFTSEQLHEMLGQSDYVVIALPLTNETLHLIGEAELRAMRPDSYLVNIGRGDIIDEPVLIRALREHWIAGAGLDVASQEPLPADSPLYDLPNLILTPHVSGGHERYAERLGKIFTDNLRRYRAGQPLRNRVDKQRGY